MLNVSMEITIPFELRRRKFVRRRYSFYFETLSTWMERINPRVISSKSRFVKSASLEIHICMYTYAKVTIVGCSQRNDTLPVKPHQRCSEDELNAPRDRSSGGFTNDPLGLGRAVARGSLQEIRGPDEIVANGNSRFEIFELFELFSRGSLCSIRDKLATGCFAGCTAPRETSLMRFLGSSRFGSRWPVPFSPTIRADASTWRTQSCVQRCRNFRR